MIVHYHSKEQEVHMLEMFDVCNNNNFLLQHRQSHHKFPAVLLHQRTLHRASSFQDVQENNFYN